MSDDNASARELIRQAARGAGIGAVVAGLSRLLFFVQQLILARLLMAEAFGEFAFASLVVGLPALLANLRGAEAIVQSDLDEPGVRRLGDTAFTAQLIAAALIAGAMIAGRHGIAGVLGKTYLAPLLVGMSVLVFTAVGGPSSNSGPLMLPAAWLERRLDFIRARLPELINVVVNILVSVVLALAGAGVWSLAGGLIAGSLAQAGMLWGLAGFRPRLRLERQVLGTFLRFGWPLYLSYLLSWGYLNADYYFVGRWLGEFELGLYYMAFNLSQVPLQVRFIIGRVAFPTFSRARNDPAFLSRLYAQATRYAMALGGCVCAVGIGLAEPAVRLLLGARWAPAAPALQILLLSTLIRTGLGFNGDLLVSLGKTGTVLAATAAALGTLLALGPWMMMRWGIIGMAWAVCASSLTTALISSLVIRRHLTVHYLRELGPALACLAVVAGLGMWIAGTLGGIACLVGAGLGLMAVYLGLYIGIFDRPLAGRLASWVRRRNGRIVTR